MRVPRPGSIPHKIWVWASCSAWFQREAKHPGSFAVVIAGYGHVPETEIVERSVFLDGRFESQGGDPGGFFFGCAIEAREEVFPEGGVDQADDLPAQRYVVVAVVIFFVAGGDGNERSSKFEQTILDFLLGEFSLVPGRPDLKSGRVDRDQPAGKDRATF